MPVITVQADNLVKIYEGVTAASRSISSNSRILNGLRKRVLFGNKWRRTSARRVNSMPLSVTSRILVSVSGLVAGVEKDVDNENY